MGVAKWVMVRRVGPRTSKNDELGWNFVSAYPFSPPRLKPVKKGDELSCHPANLFIKHSKYLFWLVEI